MSEPSARQTRWPLVAFAVAVVVIAALIIVAIVQSKDPSTSGSGSASPTRSATPTSTSVSTSVSPSTGTSSSTPSSRTTSSGTSSPGASDPIVAQGFVPLWPFRDLADAQSWEQSYRQGGHQPWHLNAQETALSFTNGFLGFADVNRVTSTSVRSDGAHIGVGYRNPAGQLRTAAVLHLMRFGTDSLAPWEVVGSDDTTFTFDQPDYGSHVSSPIRAGGRITGVDESISVVVRQLGSQASLGESHGTPAGGQAQPWTVPVSYAGASSGALTVVAWTGGHTQRVERFALNGLYG